VLPNWDTVIRPFLLALGEGPVVEIGAAGGATTRKLAALAAELDVEFHSIDPRPQFDVAQLKREFPDHFAFHEGKSHDVLGQIPAPAAVLIDGDHNWYTVHGELARLGNAARDASRSFPLAIFHDVEWPYARRDMYYDPDSIPSEWRKPWARRGIVWGEPLLSDAGGGVNARLANAIEEGGPRNGVLTAIEDFVEEGGPSLKLRIVYGASGLGVLADRDLLDSVTAVRDQWECLRSSKFLLEQTKVLSTNAARAMASRVELRHLSERLKDELEESRGSGAGKTGERLE
jgi:hypothetical protein